MSQDRIERILAPHESIGWDVDGTLLGHPHSPAMHEYILAHPEKQHFIVTFRCFGMQNLIFGHFEEHLEKFAGPEAFDGILNMPDDIYARFHTLPSEQRLLYRTGNGHPWVIGHDHQDAFDYVEWKARTCAENGSTALVDDDMAHVIRGCFEHRVRHIHPDEFDPDALSLALGDQALAAVPKPRKLSLTSKLRGWLAGTAIVNNDGEPLVAYHGTAWEFDRFDLTKAGMQSGRSGENALFFSLHASTASNFAVGLGQNYARGEPTLSGVPLDNGGVIYPVYLRAERLCVSPLPQFDHEDMVAHLEEARTSGYDAVIFPEMRTALEQGVIAVFSPDQVRSVFDA